MQKRAATGWGPAGDLGRASTLRVVNQALRWRGLTAVEINAGWRDENYSCRLTTEGERADRRVLEHHHEYCN